METRHHSGRFLHFACGPYGLLVDLDAVIEITQYQPSWCADSGSASAHHGKPVRWRDRELPLIDLRLCLNLPAEGLAEPQHALVLRDSDTDKPRALVAVDDVQHILAVAAGDWYHLAGLDPRLDAFFDKMLPAPGGEQLLLCLAPVNTWVEGIADGH